MIYFYLVSHNNDKVITKDLVYGSNTYTKHVIHTGYIQVQNETKEHVRSNLMVRETEYSIYNSTKHTVNKEYL